MLRSGLKVSIKHGNIESRNGVIIAPVIKIGALKLSVKVPIPEALRLFLENEGMNIDFVTLTKEGANNEEKLLKLTGSYHITNEKIAQFIQENLDIINAMKDEQAKYVPVSFLLQGLIQSKIQEIKTNIRENVKETQYGIISGDDIYVYTVTHGDASASYLMIESPEINNRSRFTATSSLTAKATAQHHAGCHFSQNTAHGFFAQSLAAGASIYTGDMHAENAVLDSGLTLKFLAQNNADRVKLEIDENTIWAERPRM